MVVPQVFFLELYLSLLGGKWGGRGLRLLMFNLT